MTTKDGPDCLPVIDRLLGQSDLHPVLFDIGASGPPRGTWQLIASRSIFVGFDPDLRDMQERTGTGFYRSVIVNEAVTADKRNEYVTFYLTRSPYCSSTLKPDLEAQADYSIVDLFQVEREVQVKATTLDAILDRLHLERIDWFKVDSQGTDLRLFNSLSPAIRDRVLCVEIEPGLIAGYQGEDVFTDAHRDLIEQGFWLSDLNVCGSTRIRQTSVQRLQQLQPQLGADTVRSRCRETPGWVEATYLRSIDALSGRGAAASDYVMLWAFALLGRQWGFALDVAFAYNERFGDAETSRAMAAPLLAWFTRPSEAPPRARRLVAALLPPPVKNWVKQQLR